MDKNIDKGLVFEALLMAVYLQRPTQSVLVHSEQGSQYGSSDYLALMKGQNLMPSMSRRGKLAGQCSCRELFCDLKKAYYKKEDTLITSRSKDRDI